MQTEQAPHGNFWLRWGPALFIMAAIFFFSSLPSTEIPSFGAFDFSVKKLGHMLGYALLATAYWAGLGFRKNRVWLAFLLAVLYALTDEFHQRFIPGRHSSLVDVFGFDGGGAALALAVGWIVMKRNRTKRSNE